MSRILIIDDDKIVCNGVKAVLEKKGYEVIIENGGLKGFAAAKKVKPDLILLDIVMPDVDGDEVAHRIKSDKELKDIPIVFLTAIVSESEVNSEEGGFIGGHPFVAKPITFEKLVNCIEKYIKK